MSADSKTIIIDVNDPKNQYFGPIEVVNKDPYFWLVSRDNNYEKGKHIDMGWKIKLPDEADYRNVIAVGGCYGLAEIVAPRQLKKPTGKEEYYSMQCGSTGKYMELRAMK